jgi:hypothetical protein
VGLLSADGSPGIWRILFRILIALSVPALIIVWLLHSAAAQQEFVNARNLRWLGQMANRIRETVQAYDQAVRDRAESESKSETDTFSIKDLHPYNNESDCATWKHLDVVDTGEGARLRFRATWQAHAGSVTKDRDVCAEADLTSLVEPALRTSAFTSIVLAKRSGKVLYQSGTGTLRITDTGFLFTNEGEAKPAPGKTTAPPANALPPDARGKNSPTSTAYLTRRIGDRQFSVFVQPVPILMNSDDAKDGQGDWLLIGLSERQGMLQSTAPSDLLLFLPIVVLLALVTWPLPRLWFMSPSDVLRRRDLALILACSIGAVLFLSLLCLSRCLQQMSKARMDQQLSWLAASIGKNFKMELQQSLDQLKYLDGLMAEQQPANSQWINTSHVHTRFEYVDWIQPDGYKTIRWSSKKIPLEAAKFADRSYFRDIRDHSGFTLPAYGSDEFAIEQVISRTTGQALTMIAIPSRRKDLPVADIAANFASVSEPVLPPNFGFAILDSIGRVLFHSERDRILVENLFDECQASRELQGVVARRVQAFLNLNYAAKPQRALITPLPGLEALPWTLMVYRDTAPTSVFRMQMLADTMLLFLVYSAIAAAALAAVYLLFRRRGFRVRSVLEIAWWAHHDPGYPLIAAAGGVLLLVLWRSFAQFSGGSVFYVAVAGTLAFIAITTLGLRYPCALRHIRGHAPAENSNRWTVLRMVGVPAVLFILCLALGDWPLAVAAPLVVVAAGWILPRVFGKGGRQRYRWFLKSAWLAWCAEFVLIACVAPCFLLAKLSVEYELELRIRDSQWRLWQADLAKRRDITREIQQIAGEDREAKSRLLRAIGVGRSEADTPPLYFYGSAASRMVVWPEPPAAGSAPACPSPRAGSWLHQFAGRLPEAILASIELPRENRLMGFDARVRKLEPAEGLWHWGVDRKELRLCSGNSAVAASRLPTFDPFRFRMPPWPGGSGAPKEATAQFVSAGVLWLALALLTGAFVIWMAKLRSRLLLADLNEAEVTALPDDSSGPQPNKLFLLAAPGSPRPGLSEMALSVQRIDLAGDELPPKTNGNALLLDHFEARFGDEQARRARLDALEGALLDEDRTVVVVSTIDCVKYLATGGAGAAGTPATESELARWRVVMNHFRMRIIGRPPAAASTDYAAIWDSCSEEEKRLLAQICKHGLINPKARDLVRGLIRRGLLRRAPTLRLKLYSPGFRRFVCDAATPDQAERLQGRTARKRIPVYAIGMVMLGVALFLSQEELTSRLIGFLTTLTGGVQAMRKQFGGGDATAAPPKKE